MIKISVAVSTLVFCAGPLLAAEVPPIERLVPDKTIVLFGVRQMDATIERLKKTGLWQMWENPKMQEAYAAVFKDMATDLDQMYESLGVEKDSLVPPTGAVGFAMFTATNPDLDVPQPGFLLTADYGEQADKTAKLIEAALDKGTKDGKLDVEVNEAEGRTITTIDLSKMQPAADDEDDMDMAPDPGDAMKNVNKIHYLREGNTFVLCSDMGTLNDALDTIDGAGKTGVTERTEFQNLTGKVGAEGDAYGLVFTRDILELIGAMDESGMMAMMQPTVRSLFGKVDGYGWSLRFDGPTSMVEQRLGVLMPEGKAGLTSLIDTPLPSGKLPQFVGPDAISYGAMTFEFAGLMEVIRKVVNSNPMLAMQAGEMLPQIEPVVNQVTATLGSQVHWSTAVSRPLTASSSRTLMAIECTKPQEFENVFGGLAGEMGLESRDFLGQRIYSVDPGMMGMMMPGAPGGEAEPMSLGIGGGNVLIGSTPAVEQSLRTAGQADQASLAAAADFQRAVATINRENAIAWGYSNTVDSMEVQMVSQKAMMQSVIDDMKQWDPESAAEAEQDMKDMMKVYDAFDFDEIRKLIGPSAWQVTSVDDGFVAEFHVLGPATP